MIPLPSLEYLNECFTYNKETGTLVWNVRPVEHFKENSGWTQEQVCKSWNGRFSGKETGRHNSNGYMAVRVDDVLYRAHRIAYYLGTGVRPEYIDHISGVRDDNRLCNLRSVTHSANMRNTKKREDNSSGVTGVSYDKKTGKWRAKLATKSIGYYTDKIDAIYARHYAQADANYHTNHGR